MHTLLTIGNEIVLRAEVLSNTLVSGAVHGAGNDHHD